MKCVMFVENGGVCRVSDEEAMKLVANGKWQFSSKKIWKEQGRMTEIGLEVTHFVRNPKKQTKAVEVSKQKLVEPVVEEVAAPKKFKKGKKEA